MAKNGEYNIKIPNLHYIERNHTSLFLNYTLGLNTELISYETLQAFGYINTYLEWQECPEKHENCLYFLFNPSISKLNNWVDFYEAYSFEKSYITDYDIDRNVICVVFKIKPEYRKFPQWLLEGKFSYFGQKYAKNFIISETENKTTGKHKIKCLPQYRVIIKDSSLRKELEESIGEELDLGAELCSKPNYEEESLVWNNILQDLENK